MINIEAILIGLLSVTHTPEQAEHAARTVLRDHAHQLAEQQRDYAEKEWAGDDQPSVLRRVIAGHLADLIDPKAQRCPDARAVVRALTEVAMHVKRAADARQADFALTPDATDDAPTTPATTCSAQAAIERVHAVVDQWAPRLLPRSEAHRLMTDLRAALKGAAATQATAGPRKQHTTEQP